MIVIGVTGSFGTGKTFVSKILGSYGADVIDADAAAHVVLRKGTRQYAAVVSRFGERILDGKREIDRNVVARIVFGDVRSLRRLSEIVHPPVIRAIRQCIARAAHNRSRRAVVIDAPLLFETGLDSLADIRIVVTASLRTQVGRCRRKFGLSKKEVLARIHSQMSLGEKAGLADVVIDNNRKRSYTRRQVRELWEILMDKRKDCCCPEGIRKKNRERKRSRG